MIALIAALQRHLRTASGRRLVAHRTLVALLALALLLIPSTCAEAAGPHSIYSDPTAGHAHHAGHAGEQAGPMTQAQLEWHVLLGETGPGAAAVEARSPGTPVKVSAGPDDTSFTDLPSTMAMTSATAPAVLIDQFRLELPSTGEPAVLEATAPHFTVVSPEAPPPRS